MNELPKSVLRYFRDFNTPRPFMATGEGYMRMMKRFMFVALLVATGIMVVMAVWSWVCLVSQ